MSWTLQDEIAEAEMLQLNLGKCEGPCERDGVPRVEYTENRHNPGTYQLCGWCAVECDDYWKEMWEMYYSQVL